MSCSECCLCVIGSDRNNTVRTVRTVPTVPYSTKELEASEVKLKDCGSPKMLALKFPCENMEGQQLNRLKAKQP